MRTPVNGQPWEVRVIPNKFATLSSDVQPIRSLQPLRRRVAGFGFHEVIIDSPDHSRPMRLLGDSAVAKILGIYKQRYNALGLDPIFKKLDAGASLQPPHSQLIATPVIPSQVRHRRHEALRHSDDGIWRAAEKFLSLKLPTWRFLRALLAKIYVGLENPDLNFTVRNGPAEYVGARHFHWYVSVIPRLTRVAGFELGSGMFINTVLPEDAAEFLRQVSIDKVTEAGTGQ